MFKIMISDDAKRITWKDAAIFIIFPCSLALLMLLPEQMRSMLALKIHEPMIWQLWTSSFIHLDFNHLISNILFYFIVGITLLLLSNHGRAKKFFFRLLLATILILPVVDSLIVIKLYPSLFPSLQTSEGSSGIVSAMVGFLPFFWVCYLTQKHKIRLDFAKLYCLCLSYIALSLALAYFLFHKDISIVLILFLFFSFSLYVYRNDAKNILKLLQKDLLNKETNTIINFLIIFAPLLFFLLPYTLFPIKFVFEGTFADFFIHYTGIIFGITASFISINLLKEK